MVEDLDELQEEYKKSENYLQCMSSVIQQYLNDIDSLKNAMIDFKNHCNEYRETNKNSFNIRKKYAEKQENINWIDAYQIIRDLKGTRYLTYIKTHVKAFEGMSNQFRTKINNI